MKGINQYVNNMVYNWKNAAYNMGGDSAGESFANIESNLFINGPAVGGNCLTGGNANFHFYGADNWQDANRDGIFDPTEFTGDGGGDRQAVPYDYPKLEKLSATFLTYLLPDVGASLPYRDIADCYMVDEVRSNGKRGNLITNENELPIGVPTTWKTFAGVKATDTDGDGMPDAWEEANGTNPQQDDAMTIAQNGYANIENYINSITQADRQFYLRQPMLLELKAATTNSLTLAWADYTEDEEGFMVEVKRDGQFVEVGRTQMSPFTITADWLKPATAYEVRVCAYQGEQRSDYTDVLTVKTRPEQTDIIDVETFTGNGEGEWLINPTEDEVIMLDEAKELKAVVVRSDADVTINGTGYIAGAASLNKAGKGVLTIASDQQYEGATVLHEGVYEFSTLKDGGVASGLGKSQEFAQNWVMDGGTYRYTGATTATNRSAKLYNDTEFEIAGKSAIVTMNGSMEGSGNLVVAGEGQLLVGSTNFFKYDGDLVVKGGEVKLKNKDVSDKGIGQASRLVMAGGKFTTIGKNEASVTYNFPIVAQAGTTSTVDFDLWNTNKCSVTGTGTLIWNVHYLREYIEGNWDGFTGQLIVNGTGKEGQSQFAVRNGTGIKNATLQLKGKAAVKGAKNASTFYLGGLSGDAGTTLSGFNVKAKGEGTWIVGTANTHETFRGVIDDNDQAGTHPGKTSITKQGSGDWRLTGANTYSGATQVQQGRLIINGTHSGTGAVTVASGATLAGKGTITGAVTINAGGILQVGDTLATDRGLTFKATLKLGQGAVLQLNEAMAGVSREPGATIQAFKGTATGTFAEIIPATPGEGLEWDTSELYSKGILRVVVSTAVNTVGMGEQPVQVDYYQLSGERVDTPAKGGVYIMRTTTADGQVYTQKVNL